MAKKLKTEPAKRGRPTTYTSEVGAKILGLMATGKSLRSICKADDMPDEAVVRHWAAADVDGFASQFTRAREAQVEALAEDLIEIADNDTEDVNRSRLKVDTRKWVMSKIVPKKYGDKVHKEITGADGGPVNVNVNGMTDEQLANLEAALAGATGPAGRTPGDGKGGTG